MSGMELNISHVKRSFGAVKAVQDVWLTAPEGSVMGVIGPNGAGKTTTMRMILRIIPPESGDITWLGKPVDAWPLGTFGYLPEERGLYPKMRVRDELCFFAQLHGLSTKEALEQINHWTDILDMSAALNAKVEELSKGNAQKVQFLAAVIHRPALVILDEPFSGLDPVNTRLFMAAVKHLSELGSTILFSSHQMDYVEELCDRVCLIAQGRTLVHGPIDEVRQASGKRMLMVRLKEYAAANSSITHPLQHEAGVELISASADSWRYELAPGTDTNALLRSLQQMGHIQHFSVDYPSIEDVYLATVANNASTSLNGIAKEGA
jgi:ABC-2 type transport system ATP-binding protein